MSEKSEEYWQKVAQEDYKIAEAVAAQEKEIEDNQFEVRRRAKEGKWLLKGMKVVDDHNLTDMLTDKANSKKKGAEKTDHHGLNIAARGHGDAASMNKKTGIFARIGRFFSKKKSKYPWRARDPMYVKKEAIAKELVKEHNQRQGKKFLKENALTIRMLQQARLQLQKPRLPPHGHKVHHGMPGAEPPLSKEIIEEIGERNLRDYEKQELQRIIEPLRSVEVVREEERQRRRYRTPGHLHAYKGTDKLFALRRNKNTHDALYSAAAPREIYPEDSLLPDYELIEQRKAEKELREKWEKSPIVRIKKAKLDMSRKQIRYLLRDGEEQAEGEGGGGGGGGVNTPTAGDRKLMLPTGGGTVPMVVPGGNEFYTEDGTHINAQYNWPKRNYEDNNSVFYHSHGSVEFSHSLNSLPTFTGADESLPDFQSLSIKDDGTIDAAAAAISPPPSSATATSEVDVQRREVVTPGTSSSRLSISSPGVIEIQLQQSPPASVPNKKLLQRQARAERQRQREEQMKTFSMGKSPAGVAGAASAAFDSSAGSVAPMSVDVDVDASTIASAAGLTTHSQQQQAPFSPQREPTAPLYDNNTNLVSNINAAQGDNGRFLVAGYTQSELDQFPVPILESPSVSAKRVQQEKDRKIVSKVTKKAATAGIPGAVDIVSLASTTHSERYGILLAPRSGLLGDDNDDNYGVGTGTDRRHRWDSSTTPVGADVNTVQASLSTYTADALESEVLPVGTTTPNHHHHHHHHHLASTSTPGGEAGGDDWASARALRSNYLSEQSTHVPKPVKVNFRRYRKIHKLDRFHVKNLTLESTKSIRTRKDIHLVKKRDHQMQKSLDAKMVAYNNQD